MKEAKLREIAEEYLVPFFSGAWLEDKSEASTYRDDLTAFRGPCTIAFKVKSSDQYRLKISRAQPFSNDGSDVVPDRQVIRAFIKVLAEIEDALDTAIGSDILKSFQRRVVAASLLNGESQEVLLNGIDCLAAWGGKLYEGSAISASLGFRRMRRNSKALMLVDMTQKEFCAVLSNGHDTILEYNYEGGFMGLVGLEANPSAPSFCPYRQLSVAHWTTAHESRIAMTLNRLGEILIFRGQRLLFARRAGKWHFLTHEPVIKQMDVPRSPSLRRAIYETCLDASFSRTGACIGVVQVSQNNLWKNIVSQNDLLQVPLTDKSRALKSIIGMKHFENIDRRVRQEMSAIDGAMILSHQGAVLAVGAILKISSGSEGGGRMAAARALSKFGLGVKISQDGGITGYRPKKLKPAFRVM